MDYKELQDDHLDAQRVSFDFRGFLFKALNLWKLVLLSIGLALIVAYFINVRKQNIYRLDSLITVESEQNPFFTANTSISFNWGGVSGKVGKIITAVKTRSHNELVVDSLQYYMQYLAETKYHLVDIYKNAPFEFKLDKTQPQLLGYPIGIRFIDDSTFELFADFESERGTGQRYGDKSKVSVSTPLGSFVKSYRFDTPISLPFLNGTIQLKPDFVVAPGAVFYLRFLNFDSVVYSYKSAINILPLSQTSVLRLSLTGTNKQKIVDYLNTTTVIMSEVELERKNQYATNTIKFIDSSLAAVNANLKGYTDEMNAFRRQNKVFDVSDEISQISSQLKILEGEKEAEQSKLNYLNNLETYLVTKTNYTNIAAPTSVGITESNILSSVAKITGLSIERQNMEYTTREGSDLFKDIDRRIDAEKNVLLETIDATKATINVQINTLSRKLARLESQLSELPEDQQEFLKIQRQLDLSQEAYDVYLAKRSEAAIVKAANVSDITAIDEAKDIGGGLIGPNKSLNYMMALMVGFFTPMFLIFIIFLLDNTIHGSDEVVQLSKIPILGLIGKYNYKNNLVVYERPKSAVAESFRAIRSSLQFIYSKQKNEGGRTLMITSSVSGEGKTFCSINMATAYALSGKKTILLGLDLRKPKIFGDFKITNDKGIVNYLIDDESLESVTFRTEIENLDVIPSGPIPPNPSELLMSERLSDLLLQLREDYDIIILDTPPLGLVTDALQLSSFADATIFMVRLDYTKKGMLQLVNSKYRAGELKNISFVLNFYKHKNNHNYGYGYGSGYGYGYGYGTYGNAYHDNGKGPSLMKRLKRLFKINR